MRPDQTKHCGTNPVSNHTHIRDEQFWFTTAVVGFNTFLIASAVPVLLRSLASGVISLFGMHLILTRWLKIAVDDERVAAPPFNNKTASASERAGYTWWEIRTYLRQFDYVIAEFSGSLFYLSLIVVSLVAALLHRT